jgi:hypothetical protein
MLMAICIQMLLFSFQEMQSKQVDKQAFIFLKDVSFSDLRELVDYMYKEEVNVAQERLASFLQTAEALDIKGEFFFNNYPTT